MIKYILVAAMSALFGAFLFAVALPVAAQEEEPDLPKELMKAFLSTPKADLINIRETEIQCAGIDRAAAHYIKTNVISAVEHGDVNNNTPGLVAALRPLNSLFDTRMVVILATTTVLNRIHNIPMEELQDTSITLMNGSFGHFVGIYQTIESEAEFVNHYKADAMACNNKLKGLMPAGGSAQP